MEPVLRVANCSGFFGDRLSAAREMVEGGPIDVLTGDWLAELTMGILLGQRAKDPSRGYATTFLTQLEDVLATCVERGIPIVSNAGGLNPEGCADAVRALAARLGVDVRVAAVTGDDVTDRVGRGPAPHLETGEPLTEPVEVANAYLGGWGIAEALGAGAQVVVTGRVSDASPVVGAAAHHFGWARDDWDALAGAVAAAHVIECGAQATGGNLSWFREIPRLEHAGFPIAEIAADGSSTITKHPGTGGAVTVDSVTAQLLYEIDGARYLNPDVVARFDALRLEQDGPDRVRISGVRGEPAPPTAKVGGVLRPGWRNAMTLVLTGLDVEAKAEVAERVLWDLVPGGRDAYEEVAIRLLRADRDDPPGADDAVALLQIEVRTPDRALAARLSRAAVESALASYPGFHATTPPGPPSAYTVFWPTLLDAAELPQRVSLDGRAWEVAPPPSGEAGAPPDPPAPSALPDGETVAVPLGRLVAARSGDKGGNATLGVWARDDATHAWLDAYLTTERLRELLPEARGLELRRWPLPNIRAVGFTLVGLLGRGVGASLALDNQAKGLGEYLRAKHVEAPAALVR